ncbi:MAG: substrate-binding domain-containing protein [Bacteroidetes bacterium]|nr:substrate-binding domain-containing protein [Bacteroidota bacterium]
MVASNLRTNSTNTIGIIVSTVNKPFISSLISGVEQQANKNGYNVLITQSYDSYQKEAADAKILFANRVEGLVVALAMETTDFTHFKQFLRKGVPLVFVDRVSKEFDSDKVTVDNFGAAYKATEHLIQQGCKLIAHFTGAQNVNVYHERKRGYLEALKKYGIPICEELIIDTDNDSSEDGYRVTQHLLDLPEPPDGIYSPNDTTAVSAIQCAKKRGVNVPNDLAIVGTNDDPFSTIIDPPLSTVALSAMDLGKIAVSQVLKRKAYYQHMVKSEEIVLKTELIIRESSLRKR